MREFDLLRVVVEFFGNENVAVPAGRHDAAYAKFNDKYLVLTCDTVNEISDFPPYMVPEEYGHMALAVTLSDLAACCAKPLYFLSSISLPEADEDLLRKVLSGMKRLADRVGVKIVGGDLDFSKLITISGFAVGVAGRIVTRAGAKPGDRVYITGITGKAELCLEMLSRGASREDLPYAENLYTPLPKINEALKISDSVGALTDVSDSLAISLHNIAAASSVRIVVDAAKIDLSPLKEYVNYDKALNLFLYGGGDFELVFTSERSDIGFEIGWVESGSGVFIKTGEQTIPVDFRGYSHFQPKKV